MHFWIWSRQPSLYNHVLFTITAVSAALIGACELALMHSSSVEEYVFFLRWIHVPLFSLLVGLVWFVRAQLGTGRLWLAWTICGLRALCLLLSLLSPVNLNFLEIRSLSSISLMGVPVAVVGDFVPNPISGIGAFSVLVMIGYSADATVVAYRRGSQRQAIVMGGATVVTLSLSLVLGVLVNIGVIKLPYVISLAYTTVFVAMAAELTREALRASQLERDLTARDAELQESQSRMELAASAADVGLWVLDVPRDEIWITEQGRSFLGFDPEERVSLCRFLGAVHPEDREPTSQAITRALENGGDLRLEYRVSHPNGTTRWVATRGRIEPNGNGHASRMRGASFDVTRRRHAEDRTKLVIEASPSGLVMADAEGLICMVNSQAERVFGYSREELLGRGVDLLLPGGLRETRSNSLKGANGHSDLTAQPTAVAREIMARRKDGSEVAVEVRLNPLPTEEGQFVLASVVDITERKKAELEAARQRNELAHLSRVSMLGELSGSLAHELNQPLTSILSNAQAAERFLEKSPTDLTEIRGIIDDIIAEDKRAGEVIHRWRLLLKKGEVQHGAVDLNQVAKEVLRLLRSDLLSHRILAATDLAPALPSVRGDRVQLQQVVLNLIINSCDAMSGVPPDQRHLLVRTRGLENGRVQLCVIDSGPGIPLDELEKIFQPFFTTKTHGMGLGLAVCRTIISAHNGYMGASNNPDRGVTVDFVLPEFTETLP
jgi:PAS domain S-box-containing protein